MERAVPDTTYRVVVVVALVCLAGLLYGVWTYFAQSWLRFPASIGLVALMAVFASAIRARATLTVGASPPQAAVVLARRPALDPDTGAIAEGAGGTLSLLLAGGGDHGHRRPDAVLHGPRRRRGRGHAVARARRPALADDSAEAPRGPAFVPPA